MAKTVVRRRVDVMEHLDTCPGERFERIEARRPSTGELVAVDRCIDCGAHVSKIAGSGPSVPERKGFSQ